MEDAILQVQSLCFSYDHAGNALDHVNLDIYKGEKIAVLGSNGAGKSTCFLNMNGVLSPDSGRIVYHGKVITKKLLNELRKNVGIVFQDADNQIIASTVAAEVSFGPMNLKLPREEVQARVLEALECLNLTEYRDRAPQYLSGGEKKRVSIADIIAMKSEIIILDEPTSSLDPLNVKLLEEVLEKLTQMGKTLLISTHDVDFAYRWAKRVVVFAGGKVIADRTPSLVFQDDAVLEQASLKKPMMLEVFEQLVKYGVMKPGTDGPKDIRELEERLFIDTPGD